MSWIYYGENEDPDTILMDWVWERLRRRRDILLNETDFRLVRDAPWLTEPWVKYRQELRDLPKTTKDPRLAEWPVTPNE